MNFAFGYRVWRRHTTGIHNGGQCICTCARHKWWLRVVCNVRSRSHVFGEQGVKLVSHLFVLFIFCDDLNICTEWFWGVVYNSVLEMTVSPPPLDPSVQKYIIINAQIHKLPEARIDFMYYRGNATVASVYDVLSDAEERKDALASKLPNAVVGSDHLPVGAMFKLLSTQVTQVPWRRL